MTPRLAAVLLLLLSPQMASALSCDFPTAAGLYASARDDAARYVVVHGRFQADSPGSRLPGAPAGSPDAPADLADTVWTGTLTGMALSARGFDAP